MVRGLSMTLGLSVAFAYACPMARAQSTDDSNTRRLLVLAPVTYGIEPLVGERVGEEIVSDAQAMGYRIQSMDVAARAAGSDGSAPSPVELWRIMFASGAERAISTRVWAENGQYVVDLLIASADGAGPFTGRTSAEPSTLHTAVFELVRRTLPGVSDWRPDAGSAPPPASGPSVEAQATYPVRDPDDIDDDDTGERLRRVPRDGLRYRWAIAVQTEAAFGTSEDSFYNHLVGARLDFRFTQDLYLGAYVAYANLRGRNGRVSNVLPYLQIEDRVRITRRSDLTIPLRASVGYLPFNGPFVRLAAGFGFPISERWFIEGDLIAPTFWVLPEHGAVSFDVSAELAYRF